jgi:glycosyltransferase involved in cell wall biosynthesis
MRLVIDAQGLQELPPAGMAAAPATLFTRRLIQTRGSHSVRVLLGDPVTSTVPSILAVRDALADLLSGREVVSIPVDNSHLERDRREAAREALVTAMRADAVALVLPADHDAALWSVGRWLPAAPTAVVLDADASPPTGVDRAFLLCEDIEAGARDLWDWASAVGSTPRPPSDDPRPSLALISPWPPARSGVADFAAGSLEQLEDFYDVTVVADEGKVSDSIPHVDRAWFEDNWWRFDRVLYHLGNNSYHGPDMRLLARAPGCAVVHDASLTAAMRSSGDQLGSPDGVEALLLQDGPDPGPSAPDFRGLRAALAPALGLLVHSEHARDLLLRSAVDLAVPEVTPLPVTRKGIPRRAATGEAVADRLVMAHFGYVNGFKGADVLVRAASILRELADQWEVVFVGEFLDRALRRDVELLARQFGVPLTVTGFVDQAHWDRWLLDATCAVQLREDSHGESSAALGELLAAGLPVICTSIGSFAELPDGVVRHVPRGVVPHDLASAVQECTSAGKEEGMRLAGQAYANQILAPTRWAAAVADMVETSYATSLGRWYAEAAAPLPPGHDEGSLFCRPRATADRHRSVWLSDTTVYEHTPFFSGIQRVTSRLHHGLLRQLDPSRDDLFPHAFGWRPPMEPHEEIRRDPLLARPRPALSEADWLLCLELDAGLPAARDEVLDARARGMRVAAMVYDVMPVLHPEWFPPEPGISNFEMWLRWILDVADVVVVNSWATAQDVMDYANRQPPQRADRFEIHILPLGIEPKAAAQIPVDREIGHFLMVGTVEPRKGHADVLDAFEELWRHQDDAALTVVGRAGWMVDTLVERMEQLEKKEPRFRWLRAAADAEVDALYARSTAVVMASRGEGFGLPVVEAAAHGCPVVVRDIPVLREVAQDHALYFQADASDLASVLHEAMQMAAAGTLPFAPGDGSRTWDHVTADFIAIVQGGRRPVARWAPREEWTPVAP